MPTALLHESPGAPAAEQLRFNADVMVWLHGKIHWISWDLVSQVGLS